MIRRIVWLIAIILLLSVVNCAKSEINYEKVSIAKLTKLANRGMGAGEAQFYLGLRYANGEGVVQNNEQAYFWWTLAYYSEGTTSLEAQALWMETDLYKSIDENLDIVSEKLTFAQRDKMNQEVRSWISRYRIASKD